MSNQYHFTTHWRVHTTIEEVSDIGDDLPRWWRRDKRVLRPTILCLIVVSALAMIVVGWASAETRTVCNVPSDDHPTVQYAINDPMCSTIYIAGGIYAENIVITRTLTLNGSADSESPTIIDGGVIDNVFTMTLETTETFTASNLTIQNGSAVNGGGLYINGGNVWLNDIDVIENTASADGGGIFQTGGSITLTNVLVAENAAGISGGGLHISDATVEIVSSEIMTNSADEQGGGLFSRDSATNVITSAIRGNIALSNDGNPLVKRGGGISAEGGGLTVTHSTISENRANNGGGIFATVGTVEVSNSEFVSNAVDASFGGGGGINLDGAAGLITGTAFTGNSAGNGGGLQARAGAAVNLFNSTFDNNSAGTGGAVGLTNVNGFANFINSLFSNNSAINNGGAFFVGSTAVFVQGSRLTENSADNGGGLYGLGSYNVIYDSTIDNNQANNGAAIGTQFAFQTVLLNSTVSNNEVLGDLGAAFSLDAQNQSLVTHTTIDGFPNGRRLTDDVTFFTIVASAIIMPEPILGDATFISGGENIVHPFDSAFPYSGSDLSTDPLLGPLNLPPGRVAESITPIRIPQSGSPAIDLVNCGTVSADQIGTARPQGARCDAGSVEVVSATTPTVVTLQSSATNQLIMPLRLFGLLLLGLTVVSLKSARVQP